MKKSLLYVGALVAVFTPILVGAQTGGGTVDNLITTVSGWLNSLIPLIIGVAVLVFLWGVVQYITAGSDSDKRKEGGYLMAYGIVGLFVMISVWGLVNFVSDATGVGEDTTAPYIPTVPGNE
jgi:mannose/fructose/N-acetylgalactosamine-specific phosphotransferase system component IID